MNETITFIWQVTGLYAVRGQFAHSRVILRVDAFGRTCIFIGLHLGNLNIIQVTFMALFLILHCLPINCRFLHVLPYLLKETSLCCHLLMITIVVWDGQCCWLIWYGSANQASLLVFCVSHTDVFRLLVERRLLCRR